MNVMILCGSIIIPFSCHSRELRAGEPLLKPGYPTSGTYCSCLTPDIPIIHIGLISGTPSPTGCNSLINCLTECRERRKTIFSNNSISQGMMVNFMCQFGWTIVPIYVVICYSGCLCEDVFG